MRLALMSAGILSAGIVSAAPSFAAPVQLVTNGGFDTGTFANWTVALTPNGRTDVGTVEFVNTTGSGASNAAKFEVGRVTGAGDGNPAGIVLSQTVTVTSSASIDFSLDVAALESIGLSNGDFGIFRLLFGDTLVDELALGAGRRNELKRGSLSGNLASVQPGQYNLSLFVLRDLQTGPITTPFQYVDNVSALATYKDVSVIPVPASGLLLLAGIGGLALARRRSA